MLDNSIDAATLSLNFSPKDKLKKSSLSDFIKSSAFYIRMNFSNEVCVESTNSTFLVNQPGYFISRNWINIYSIFLTQFTFFSLLIIISILKIKMKVNYFIQILPRLLKTFIQSIFLFYLPLMMKKQNLLTTSCQKATFPENIFFIYGLFGLIFLEFFFNEISKILNQKFPISQKQHFQFA